MRNQVAHVNIGRLAAPEDSAQLAAFFEALDPVNALADAAPGFVWRLQTEEGNATSIVAFEWDRADSYGLLMNMSVWESIEDLAAFVYGEGHRAILRRRREFFWPSARRPPACGGSGPATCPRSRTRRRGIVHVREHGPTPFAFTFRQSFGPPEGDRPHEARAGRPEWLCPA